MAVPGHRLQEISDNLCVRWELIRALRGVSREPAGYCDRENRTTGGNVSVPFHLLRPSLRTLARAPAGQGTSTRSADSSTSNIQSASATNRWAIWSQTGARSNTFVMPTPTCTKRRMIRAIADRENRCRLVELLKTT